MPASVFAELIWTGSKQYTNDDLIEALLYNYVLHCNSENMHFDKDQPIMILPTMLCSSALKICLLCSILCSKTRIWSDYRIMQIIRGGKVSRLHDLVVIRGKTFTIV